MSLKSISINPFNQETFAEVKLISDDQVFEKIEIGYQKQKSWRKTNFTLRSKLMNNLSNLLDQKKVDFAKLISNEMGMPISQSLGEIDKTVSLARYYADNSQQFLANKIIKTDSKESYVKYDPLGVMLHIAPWNFPFYLALRPIIPAIMAGNTVLLKHSSNVLQINLTLEKLFLEAGFEEGIMQSLLIESDQVEAIMRNPQVSFATLIGSERAGMQVAKVAGEEIKKTVMELGGSDAFIVLKDADLDKVFPSASLARLRNCGQSCNAAKRFIVAEEIAQEFLTRLKSEFEAQVYGDPLDEKTEIGPLAQEKALSGVIKQVEKSLQMGAKVVTGGHGDFLQASQNWLNFRSIHQSGYFYPATILTEINPEMPIWKQEVFAPVAPVLIVKNLEEAIKIANDSDYGLGVSLWTEDYETAKSVISEFEVGSVFINSMVRSNIKMPYGGVKKSGYGREMGEEGLLEFVNVKTVVIN